MHSLAGALAVAALLSGAPQAPAVNHSWDSFADNVQKGKKVTVTLMDMTRAEGKLLAIDGASLTIQAATAHRTISSADVYAVRYAGMRSRRAKFGALIGAAVGALTMWAIDQKSDNPEPGSAAAMGAVLIGVPAGAIVGAALPDGMALYQAERVMPARR